MKNRVYVRSWVSTWHYPRGLFKRNIETIAKLPKVDKERLGLFWFRARIPQFLSISSGLGVVHWAFPVLGSDCMNIVDVYNCYAF